MRGRGLEAMTWLEDARFTMCFILPVLIILLFMMHIGILHDIKGAQGRFRLNADEGVERFLLKNDGPDILMENDGARTSFSWKNEGAKTFFEAEKLFLPSTCSHNFCSLPKITFP